MGNAECRRKSACTAQGEQAGKVVFLCYSSCFHGSVRSSYWFCFSFYVRDGLVVESLGGSYKVLLPGLRSSLGLLVAFRLLSTDHAVVVAERNKINM